MLQQFDLFCPAENRSDQPRLPFAPADFLPLVREFDAFGARSIETETRSSNEAVSVPTFVNEFWTAKQCAAHSLHEISYRACFKPQLPRFFIERLTAPGDLVYDPFMGRGTTPLEAALLGRVPAGNDLNPLSAMLLRPRLQPPTLGEIAARLNGIDLNRADLPLWEDLLAFYHPETLREITALKAWLLERSGNGDFDAADDWIRMTAINRLTGHSAGFFSVYTLPPNQATSVKAQRKINADRNQVPPWRQVRKLILRKSADLMKDLDAATRASLNDVVGRACLLNCPAAETPALSSNSVSLVVTSPPFLDVVNYAGDNWLRCWFAGIDAESLNLTVPSKLEVWQERMTAVFRELHRVLKPGGHIAFEVGEVRRGKIKLEETVLTCGLDAGLHPVLVLINQQEFTKTANCWGVDNNAKGTNTNRVVVFEKRG